jgi:hypothetical protein
MEKPKTRVVFAKQSNSHFQLLLCTSVQTALYASYTVGGENEETDIQELNYIWQVITRNIYIRIKRFIVCVKEQICPIVLLFRQVNHVRGLS